MIDAIATSDVPKTTRLAVTKPRLGFLGVGWIGRNRMEAIARSGVAEIAGIADSAEANAAEAGKLAPHAEQVSSLDDLLKLDLDGVVIATPNALHVEQAISALESGAAVFCQKPLARTREETEKVVSAARSADRLLAVDLSYRFTTGIQQIRRIVRSGELGKIFAANLVFHNAYGPDKPWFYDYRLSGGGCVLDLGIHLVDLAFWILNRSKCLTVIGCLFSGGEQLRNSAQKVEDFAVARIDLEGDTTLQLSCSWKLHAGCDAVIRASFYGTQGGAEFRNVDGSFYDFRAERFHGTQRELLAGGREEWGCRAALDWVKRLAEGQRYDASIEGLIDVAKTVDAIYQR
jgi:predicted dehydrogenase